MSFEIDVELRRGARTISATFAAGPGLTALVAPSGWGKTSLLDAVAGLLRPARGRIAVGGEVLFDSAARIDRAPEKRCCGYVFQDLRLFPHRTVRDNLLFGWKRADPARRWMSLDEAAGFLDIAHLLARRPDTLSGGEARRVAIGRALLAAPRFLLLDEPLSSLDPARRAGIVPVIARIRDELALPILHVSHDPAEIAGLATRVVALDQVPQDGLEPA